jgi:hypothetical protein
MGRPIVTSPLTMERPSRYWSGFDLDDTPGLVVVPALYFPQF